MEPMSSAMYGEMKPRSNSMPFLTSRSMPNLVDFSTEMTPSWPISSRASAIFAPISGSPEETVAISAICSRVVTCVAAFSSSSDATSAAFWMPRRSASGSLPAVT